MELWEKLKQKLSLFTTIKVEIFALEFSSRRSILLEIVQNWYAKCQRHKKIRPHFSSVRARSCPVHTVCIQGNFIAYRGKWSNCFSNEFWYFRVSFGMKTEKIVLYVMYPQTFEHVEAIQKVLKKLSGYFMHTIFTFYFAILFISFMYNSSFL